LTGLRSLEPMHEIGRLAALARQLPPDLRQALLVASSEELQVRLRALPAGRDLLTDVERFLDRFGFLSSNGSDFTASTWADNPTLVWRAVARAAASPNVASPLAAAAAREEARRHVRGRLNPVERRVFDSLLASVTVSIELRESVSLMMSEYSYQIRRIFLALADRLASKGDLTERENLFYLAYDEMIALVGGCLQIDEARARIAARRTEIEADAQITPPSVISGNPELAYRATPPELEVDAYLSGIAASSGTAQGRARVVNDPAEAPASLGREDILVVPYSDVGWTPLFASIGGIVAETGGQLSHAAIVAREYGLPAVVGVKDATRLIREGQPLSLDGNRGRVYLNPEVA
jgi:phosphohistidine swiveling domain-containing protein